MPLLLKHVINDIELFFNAYKNGEYNFSPKGGIYFENKKPSQIVAFGEAVSDKLDALTNEKLTFIKNHLANIRIHSPLADYDCYPTIEQNFDMVYNYEGIFAPLLERCLIEMDKCAYKNIDFSILTEKDIALTQLLSLYKELTQEAIEELSTRYTIRLHSDFIMPKNIVLPKPFKTVIQFAQDCS